LKSKYGLKNSKRRLGWKISYMSAIQNKNEARKVKINIRQKMQNEDAASKFKSIWNGKFKRNGR